MNGQNWIFENIYPHNYTFLGFKESPHHDSQVSEGPPQQPNSLPTKKVNENTKSTQSTSSVLSCFVVQWLASLTDWSGFASWPGQL